MRINACLKSSISIKKVVFITFDSFEDCLELRKSVVRCRAVQLSSSKILGEVSHVFLPSKQADSSYRLANAS